ncbi:MAG: hypothetical protein JWR62_1444 [Modestobacter sp.]|jgi:hypothetical protein|nr:hypothetical protein [Modestobacter sp.]
MTACRPPVVVAVTVAHPVGEVLEWAAAEAAARGARLRIVHALQPQIAFDPWAPTSSPLTLQPSGGGAPGPVGS